MKYGLLLIFVFQFFLSSCIGDIQSYLEIPIAIQKEIHAQSVHITEAQFENLAAIHITLKDSDIINPKTDLFKIQSIAYKSAHKAYELYTRRHAKSLNNYRVDIAYKDSFYRYYYYDSLQFAKKDIYWGKIKSIFDCAKNSHYNQLTKFIADSVDTAHIIKTLKEFNYGKKDVDIHFFALEDISLKNGWLTRYWIKCGSENKYQMIALLLDQEKGNIKDVIINASKVITVND